jgi:hypothetical protein
MSARFDVHQDDDGSFRFQLMAGNGEPVAESQPYRSLADARAGMAAVQRAAAEAPVPAQDADIAVQQGIHMHFEMRPPPE